jgi:hypothetical protein
MRPKRRAEDYLHLGGASESAADTRHQSLARNERHSKEDADHSKEKIKEVAREGDYTEFHKYRPQAEEERFLRPGISELNKQAHAAQGCTNPNSVRAQQETPEATSQNDHEKFEASDFRIVKLLSP